MDYEVGPIGEPRRRSAARVWAPALLAIALPLALGVWLQNRLVMQREAVDAAWAQVESSYQRRADLVPALVEAVKRHMRHESETLVQVVAARGDAARRFSDAARELAEAQQESSRALAAVGGTAPSADGALDRVSASQAGVGRGIRQVLALSESYPTLRSADQFLELQAQLEGSENRIHVARMSYNDAVRAYNAALEQFPTRSFARARGWERRAYFRTDESARHAAPLGLD